VEANDTFELDHLSQISISQMQRCGMQFYLQRVARVEPTFRNAALVVGSVFHAAVASTLNAVRDGIEVTKESALAVLDALWESELAVETPPVRWGKRETPESQLKLLKAMTGKFLTDGLPSFLEADILGVEARMRVPLVRSDGAVLETPLVTVADVIVRDAGGSVTVIDFKTSANGLSDLYVETDAQPSAYLLAAEHAGHTDARFEYHIISKKSKPTYSVIPAARTREDLDRLWHIAAQVERAVRHSLWMPTSPDGWACASCPWSAACRTAVTDVTVPAAEAVAVA
jgi:CRISPR/Cas system-associated exonuclease Cas4 (RecB family)